MLLLRRIGTLALIAWLVGLSPAWAAEAQKTLQMAARILPRASLSLDRTQITFVGYEDQAVIPSQEGPMAIMAKGRASPTNPLTLTVRADSDLANSQSYIPAQQVQWTYRGRGATSGTLNRGNDQVVNLWTNGGVQRGELQFMLNNKGHLAPGDYTGAIVLTLSSP
jgi:hypothetical protein